MIQRTIMHIDTNSAYLAWSAVYDLTQGITEVDYRTIPAVVGGSKERRSGIVLAKSIPAKAYNIQTGETLYATLQKCPHPHVVSPRYDVYALASKAMLEILQEYSPVIQRFSIDEIFLDYTNMEVHFGDPVSAANAMRERIYILMLT